MSHPNTVDFDAIKRSVTLSDVLSRYIRVPPKAKYRIPCILHGGESYNLSIDDEKGLFHCFTCGAAGDVVMLLAKLENLSNIEAGRRLAAEYGVRGAAQTGEFNAVWNELKRWNPKTVEVLPMVELPASEPLTSYRGYSQNTIERFGLRLVPNGVLIPFRDMMTGKPVGYSIRQINRRPKYLNSEGFKKADYLYGMYEYIESGIQDPLRLILCEGQFDCIRISDSGHKNVVATLGASLTPAQAYILGHWAGRLTILYDGDEAGRVGAQKIKDTYSSMFHIVIKSLPEGEDPDTGDLGILDDGE